MIRAMDVLALALLAAHVARVAAEPRGLFGWQVHSVNDLREWDQLFVKGSRYFKIDPYWTDSATCAVHGINDSRGCFLLGHDRPLPLASRLYHTLEDVLEYLVASPWSRSDETVDVALCFKNPPAGCCCNPNDRQERWLSLVDDFFDEANAQLQQHSLNVRFILDGGAKPEDRNCLEKRWDPWQSVWISTPVDAFLSDDQSQGYHRFTILNPPVRLVDEYAAKDFGKFQGNAEPVFVWEPEDQSTIEKVAQSFLSVPHQAGYRFSSNTDPAMLQVYVAGYSGTAWHQETLQNADLPRVHALHTRHGLLLLEVAHQGLPVYQLSVANSTHGLPGDELSVVDGGVLPLPEVLADVDHVCSNVQVLDDSTAFVSTQDGLLLEYELDVAQGVSLRLRDWVQVAGVSVISPFVDEQGEVLFIAAGRETRGVLRWRRGNGVEWVVRQPQALPIDNVTDARSIPLTAAASSFSRQSSGCPHLLLYASSFQNTVYASASCLSLVTSRDVVLEQRGEAVIVGVGSHPHLSMSHPDPSGEVHVGLVHMNAYCYNTIHHNFDTRTPLCEQEPVSTDGPLSYSYFTASDVSFLLSGDALDHRGFTPCTAHVHNGVYDQGHHPSAAVYLTPDGLPHLVAVHESVDDDFQETDRCGLPEPHQNSAVLDGWTLLQHSLL